MTIVVDYAGAVKQTYTSGATTASVTKPASLNPGDLWFVAFSNDATSVTISEPSGWARVDQKRTDGGDGQGMDVFYRIAWGNEGASQDFTTTALAGCISVSFAVSGADFNVAAGAGGVGSIAFPAPQTGAAITTTVDGSLLLHIGAPDIGTTAGTPTFTAPSGYTARLSHGNANYTSLSISDKQQTTAGTEAAATGYASLAAQTGRGCAIQLALSPITGPRIVRITSGATYGLTRTTTITAPKPGNSLIVVCSVQNVPASFVSLKDNLGVDVPLDYIAADATLATFRYHRVQSATASQTAFTLTASASDNLWVRVYEVAGLSSAAPTLATVINNTAGYTAINTFPVTLPAVGELIIGTPLQGGVDLGFTPSYPIDNTPTEVYGAHFFHGRVAQAGSQTYTCTRPSGQDIKLAVVTYAGATQPSNPVPVGTTGIASNLAFLWSGNKAQELVGGLTPAAYPGSTTSTADGTCYVMGGQTDVIRFDAASSPNLSGGDFTVMVWLDRLGNSTSAWRGPVSCRDTINATGHWGIGGYGADFQWIINGSAPVLATQTPTDLNNCSYAVVGTAASTKGFLSGVLAGTGVAAIPASGSTSSVRLGQIRGDASNEGLLGNYRAVAIFTRALSDDEIAALHENPWLLFDEGSVVETAFQGDGFQQDAFQIYGGVVSGGGGGTTYNETLTETLAATDAYASSMTMAAALTETTAASESYAPNLVMPNAMTESVAAGDSLASTQVHRPTLTESVAVTDSVVSAQTFASAVVESIAAGDGYATSAVFGAVYSESVTLGDSFSGGMLFLNTLSEPIGVTDSLATQATMHNALTAAVAVGDGVTASAIFNSGVTESITPADTPAGPIVFAVSLSEGVTLADSYADSLAGGPQTYNESISEALAVADAYVSAQTFANTLAESVGLTESSTGPMVMAAALGETVGLADGTVGSLIMAASLGEAIAVAESLGATKLMVSVLGETLTLTADLTSTLSGSIVWPDPSQVLAGVQYGPTGLEYTGTYTDGIRIDLDSGQLIKPIGSKLAIRL